MLISSVFLGDIRPPDNLVVLGRFSEPLLCGILSILLRDSFLGRSRNLRLDPEVGCEEALVGVCNSSCCADDGIGPTDRLGDELR